MPLKDDLEEKVSEFVATDWPEIPDGYVVPTPEDLTLGNTGKHIDACVLYADIHGSTDMVDALNERLAAEYYKAFLHCAAKIIKDNDGSITAYDGDRVMAIYLGENRAYNAACTAFRINYAVRFIINPKFNAGYPEHARTLKHTVGIDCGKLLAAKAGVREDLDLVWVGSAANYAAKLNSFEGLDIEYSTRVTTEVYDKVSTSFNRRDNTPIWEGQYNNLKKKLHYRSNAFMEI